MPNNIAIISDVHIKLLSRHDEYREIFKNFLYPSLRENNVKLIVLLGDLVHSKLQLSPEEIDLVAEFLFTLNDIADTKLILGNHDVNITNVERLDAISPILDFMKLGNTELFKHSGLYTHEIDNKYNLIFGVHSIIDSPDKWPKINAVKSKFKNGTNNISIALYHGPLSYSYTDITAKFNYNIFKDNLNIGYFEGWDQVWLGDIHRRQWMRKDKSAFYGGSLIQQDHGEDYNKGYTLFDLKTRKNKFIPIQNDYGFHTIEISGTTVPENIKGLSKNPKIRVFTDLDWLSVSDRENIRYQIYKNYNPLHVMVSEKPSEELILENKQKETKRQLLNKHDTRNLSVISSLINDYLLNKNISKEDIEKILDINKNLFQKLSPEDVKRGINWKLKKLEFSGLFSYRNKTELDFNSLNGITGLFGHNGSGKSAIIDIILYTLFNKISRKERSKDIVNRKTKKGWAKLIFEIDNEEYTIERSTELFGKITEEESGNTNIDFYKTVDDEKYCLNGENKWDTNNIIRTLMGNIDDLTITSFSPQEKLLSFIDTEPRERKDMLATFLDLIVFEELYRLADEEFDEIERYLKQAKKKNISKEISNLEDNILENKKLLTGFRKEKKRLNNLINQNNKKIQKYSSDRTPNVKTIDIEQIDSQIKNVEAEINKKLIEGIRLKSEAESLLLLYTELKDQYTDDKKLDISAEVDTFKKLMNAKSEMEPAMNILQNSINRLEKSITMRPPEECNIESCEFRSSIIDSETELKDAQNKYTILESRFSNLKEALNDVGQPQLKMIEFENGIYKIKKVLDDIKLRKERAHSLIESNRLLKDKLELLNNEKEEYHKNQKIIEKNKTIDKKILNNGNEVSDLNNKLREIDSDIVKYSGKIKVVSSNIKLLKDAISKIKKMDESYRIYKIYMNALHRNGIAHNIIEQSLPIINSEINRILSNVVEFELRFDIYKDTKKINIWLLDKENGRRRLEGCSGQEKTLSSIAIRTALANLSSLPKPDVFIIDEGFGTLDPDNVNSMSRMFDMLLKYFSKIIIVTHVDVLRDSVRNILEVRKENGISTIIKA